MAIPNRNATAAAPATARTFFVTTSTAGGRRYFQSDRNCELLVRILYEYRAASKFQLHDFCIMPDHVHLLLTVPPQITVERAVQFIKGGFAYRARKELGSKPPIWQRGFSEVRILDAESFGAHRTYIRQNPVKARMAVREEEFRFSSAFDGYELDGAPVNLRG